MKRLRNLLLVIIFCVFGLQTVAQSIDINGKEKKRRWYQAPDPDSNFIKTYKNKLMISLIGTRKYQYVEIEAKDGANSLIYKPNNHYGFGAGISYKSISIDLTLKVPYLSKDYKLRGKTDMFRVRLGYNRPKLWFSTMLQIIQGMYLENVQQLDPTWFDTHNDYLLRPDMFNLSWYTAAYYSFNYDKLTYQSSLGLEQRQKKSAGTFLLGGSLFLNYLSADSTMVPTAFTSDYMDEMNLTEQFNLQYGLNFGYVHTFVITPKLYLSLSVFPGIHYQSAHHITPLTGKQDISGDFGSITEIRAAIGYNTDKYFGGINLNEVAILHFPQNTVLTNGYAFLKFFVGRRFNFHVGKGKKKKV